MKRILAVIISLAVVMSGTLVPAFQRTAYADNPERLDVPSFRQIWAPWGQQTVGFSSDLIENAGCALNSLAMVLKYYGVDTDPEELNNWLKENGGYLYGSTIVWSRLPAKSDGSLKYIGTYNFPNGADLEQINRELDNGYPVIARMDFRGTGHYVVITGYSGTTYYINDPWTEDQSWTINERHTPYNDPANAIKSIVVFRSDKPTPSKVPIVSVASVFEKPQYVNVPDIIMPQLVLRIGDSHMELDGVRKEIDPGRDTRPVVINGRMLLPVRAVAEAMKGKVEWEDKNRKITIDVQGRVIEMWEGKKTMFINGWEFGLEVEPRTVNGRTLVPLRLMMEKLGCTLDWDEAAQKVTIRGPG